MTPYYQDSAVTIYHCDCREILPRLKVDLALFDPPYGCDVAYGAAYDDSRESYWEWFLPCLDLIRASARTVVFTHRVAALQSITGQDWTGVWHKPCAMGARIGNSVVLPHWEPIFMFGIHHSGTRTQYLPDVITCNPERAGGNSEIGRAKWKSEKQAAHPCPKPLDLFLRLLLAFGQSSAGPVLDPFMGSGTTLRAAKDLGRNAIGIEIEERYCEIAAKRMAQEALDFGEREPVNGDSVHYAQPAFPSVSFIQKS